MQGREAANTTESSISLTSALGKAWELFVEVKRGNPQEKHRRGSLYVPFFFFLLCI